MQWVRPAAFGCSCMTKLGPCHYNLHILHMFAIRDEETKVKRSANSRALTSRLTAVKHAIQFAALHDLQPASATLQDGLHAPQCRNLQSTRI